MKNHWLKKNDVEVNDFWLNEMKETDKKIIDDIRDELDMRHPFLYQLHQNVKIDIEGVVVTGKVAGCYRETTGDGWINKYSVKLDKDFYGFSEMDFPEIRLKRSWDWNILSQYRPGDEKNFEHNFKVKSTEDPNLTLNPDTFCPQNHLNIKLTVGMDSQHDGHGWDKEWMEKCHNRLVEEIIADIKAQIEPFVRKVNPFSIHYYP